MDKSVTLKNNISILLSILYFTVLSVYLGFINTPFTPFQVTWWNKFIIILCIIFILWMLLQKYSIKEFCISVLLLVFAAVAAYNANTSIVISILSAIIFSKNNFKLILGLIALERSMLDLFLFSFSLMGKIQNKVIVAKSGKYVVGYGLGFDNPNSLSCEIGMLILIYIMIREYKINYKDIFGIAMVSWITYLITMSRTFILLMIVMVILLLIIKKYKNSKLFKKLEVGIGILILAIGYLVSIGIPYIINLRLGNLNTYIEFLNKLTSNRFLHASRVMINYPITLFGGVVDFDKLDSLYGYSIIDNSYIQLLYGFGIIGSIIVGCLYIATIIKIFKINKPYWMLPVIIFLLWGISEGVLYSLHWNISILLWGLILYNQNSESNNINVRELS